MPRIDRRVQTATILHSNGDGLDIAVKEYEETFACDGQPGSATDIDHCDVICLYGQNMAETQTVLWTRVLDRLAGPGLLLAVVALYAAGLQDEAGVRSQR